MYAIIATGGKQEKVAKGQQVHVELLDAQEGSEVKFTPIMLVDGSTILTTPAQLAKSSVTAKVMGIAAGQRSTALLTSVVPTSVVVSVIVKSTR